MDGSMMKRMKLTRLTVCLLLSAGCSADGPGRDTGLRVVQVTSVDSTTGRMERSRGWSDDALRRRALVEFLVSNVADLRSVLNLDRSSPPNHSYVPASFPPDLSGLSPGEKKRLFLASLRPIVIFHNQAERYRRARLRQTPDDRVFIRSMSAAYGVDVYPKKLRGYPDTLNVLNWRIGPVPKGLVLGQAALESGWGTSRLAIEKNNLFGQKRGKGRYSAFGSLSESVEGYLRNVNTHGAYSDFRNRRRRALSAGKQAKTSELIGHLSAYSTRGKAYLEDLRRIISQNNLDASDRELPPVARDQQ